MRKGKQTFTSTKVRCIVTGFEAFGRMKTNPTEQIIQSLSKRLHLSKQKLTVPLTGLVLPTCCDGAWQTLRNELAASGPNRKILVLTGLAAGRKQISLERFALNIRDYEIADNSGHKWRDTVIENGGINALRTKVDLVALQEHLTAKGVACSVSNHAGSFVCNDIYFRALSYQRRHKQLTDVLFVHLPLPRAYAKTLSKRYKRSVGSAEAMQEMKSAVVAVARYLIQA